MLALRMDRCGAARTLSFVIERKSCTVTQVAYHRTHDR